MNTPLTKLLSLTNKTVLITGGAQGIGKAIAMRYAEAGASIQLLDIHESKLAATAAELAERYGTTVTSFIVDLSDSKAIEAFWKSNHITPDILINNAGIFSSKNLDDITDRDYDMMMNVNTRSVMIMCREMIKRRKHNPGTIINISSIEAIRGMTPGTMLYGMSKAALLAVTRALVKDYAKKGWKINTILPGGVSTPGATAMGMTALKHFDLSIITTGIKFSMRMPTKGMGKPDDIARAALWLGTPMSDYMNGAEVAVDGGFLAV